MAINNTLVVDTTSKYIVQSKGIKSEINQVVVDAANTTSGTNESRVSLVEGTADDNTGHVQIQFKGASADTIALQLAGTGHYDGTAGKITNNATNAGATSGDLELTALGTSGSVIIELRKDTTFTA